MRLKWSPPDGGPVGLHPPLQRGLMPREVKINVEALDVPAGIFNPGIAIAFDMQQGSERQYRGIGGDSARPGERAGGGASNALDPPTEPAGAVEGNEQDPPE